MKRVSIFAIAVMFAAFVVSCGSPAPEATENAVVDTTAVAVDTTAVSTDSATTATANDTNTVSVK